MQGMMKQGCSQWRGGRSDSAEAPRLLLRKGQGSNRGQDRRPCSGGSGMMDGDDLGKRLQEGDTVGPGVLAFASLSSCPTLPI